MQLVVSTFIISLVYKDFKLINEVDGGDRRTLKFYIIREAYKSV